MDKKAKKMLRLRGVGEILAARFLEAGIDSYEKVAAAGEEELKKIKGMNPRAVSGILAQASELASEAAAEPKKKLAELCEKSAVLTGRIQEIASDVRERFREEITGRIGKKIEKQIAGIAGSLDMVTTGAGVKQKRAAKGLARAEKHLGIQAGAGLEDIRKSLKKARKSLKRIFP
ncbi:MAG TPA: helix-hairpin-helix domain-containing protein [Geobacteraceae bacterium]|nr:helix-hairpin-helix domain-containing protein [Geobacteraceae bacterium]